MHNIEVEIKSLLGSLERADEVRKAMQEADPNCRLQSKNTQLNHYFKSGTLQKLSGITSPHLSDDAKIKLKDLADKATEFSVRTRNKDGVALLVVKATIGDDTSANGISRREFEEKMALPFEELDTLVLSAGFEYEAKWSREREEYLCKGTNVTLDKNAGYGWLAEFERIVEDEKDAAFAQHEIRNLMQELGVSELKQERLARMFAHYNEHWPDYYGTEKIFVIE
ncbi:CYTH domain-containing protein [Candidatus Kaiserbacteria bacterium]|nr:CYTH domain-containing protein [Candidatus Kaiserbacteria bacterium]